MQGHVTANELWKRTAMAVLLMVGACVAFVGTASAVAVLVTSHAVGPASGARETGAVDASETRAPAEDHATPASPAGGADPKRETPTNRGGAPEKRASTSRI